MMISDTPALAETRPAGTAARWRRRLLLPVLIVIFTYAYLDRAALALLVEPIRHDLGLSDIQMSLLLGLAFSLFYGLGNLPAGYLVDRFSRRALIMVATALWATMTVFCGLATSFAGLFIARAGVGLAETIITPASFSLIREHVAEDRRARAFSFFAMSPLIGSSLSLAGGAMLVGAASRGAFAGVPVLGGLFPWQVALALMGLIGLPLAALPLLLASEGKRTPGGAAGHAGYGDAFRHIGAHIRVYAPLMGYVAITGMMAFAAGAWMPALVGRKWHMSPEQVGPMLGAVSLGCGVLGLLASSVILDRIGRKGGDIFTFGMIAVILSFIGYTIAPLMDNLGVAMAAYGFAVLFSAVYFPVGATSLARLTPPQLMGKISGIYLLIQMLISQALSPVLVATLAQNVFSGDLALAYAMAVFQPVVGLTALACVLILRRTIRRDAAI